MLTKILLILIVLYLFVRFAASKRKKFSQKSKPTPTYPGSTIQSHNKRFRCFLTSNTPTGCILRDNRFFGDYFKEKVPPALCVGCRCEYSNLDMRRYPNFSGPSEKHPRETDLGFLSANDYQYYRSYLLSQKEDLSEAERAFYEEKLNGIQVTEDFIARIRNLSGVNQQV